MSTICMPFLYEPASAYWRPPRRVNSMSVPTISVAPFFSSYGRFLTNSMFSLCSPDVAD